MYDAKYIVPGLALFLGIVTLPLWYNPLAGRTDQPPVLEYPEGQCVVAKPLMKGQHMQILNAWRNEVVREDSRYYVHPDGTTREKSLTGTCLGCHEDKAEFCDRCHDYAGVKPYCFDCHIVPEGK